MTIPKITLICCAALLFLAPVPPFEYPTDPPKYPKPKQHSLTYQQQVLPPPEFDRPYDGELTIRHLDAAGIWNECHLGAKPDRAPPLACARRGTKSCTVYILTEPELEKLGWSYDIIMRHELGHCHGWHHD